MAQPTPYTRQYNFNDFQTTSPASPLPGTQVDTEFNSVKSTLDDLNTNIALIQQDDGKIKNQSIHKDSFDAGALALMNTGSYTIQGDWTASRSYVVGDLVDNNGATYVATSAHTSSAAFETDLTANKWILIANAGIANTASKVDKFEGTGSQTAFTLTASYTSNTDVMVFVNGALKNPGDDFSISTNTITFVTAPSTPAVSGNENVIVFGASVVAQAAIEAAQLAQTNASGFANEADNWARLTTGLVESTDYSSKAYAIGGTGVDNGSGSAKDWATKTSGTVGNTSEYSAKYWATQGNVPIVATNIADINTTAGLNTEITAVAGKATEIGLLGQTTPIANMALLGTSTVVGNMGLLGTSTVVGHMANLNGSGVISNIGTVSGSIANVNLTGANITNVNILAGLDTEITALGAIPTEISGVNAIASDVTGVNTISSAVSAVNSNATNINNLSTSANITAMANLGTTTNVANMANLNASGVIANMANLNGSGVIANIGTTAGISTDVTSVANIASDVSSLANSLEKTYVVTVANVGGQNVFVLDGVNNPTITMFRGNTYIFDLSNGTNATHPLAFKDGSGSAWTTGVTTTGTAGSSGAKVEFEVPSTAPSSMLYYCVTHGNAMGNTITVKDSNVSLVAGSIANVNLTGGSIGNVNTLAGLNSEISTLSGISSAITGVDNISSAVSGVNTISSAVTGVNNISSAVSTVANNIAGVNSFGERYRVQSGVPSSSNDVGDLVFDTAANTLKVFGSSGFQNAGSSVNGTSNRFTYNITGTPTTVSGTDANGETLAFDPPFLDVYLNGVKMSSADITVSSGNSVVFGSALASGDVVDIVAFGTFQLASINASNLVSGTVPVARLGSSGTRDNTTFLRGDNTFAVVDTTNASNLSTGTLPNSRLSSVPNSALANSNITINGSAVALGGSVTLSPTAGSSSLVTTGALDSGSITSGFGNIDTGSSTITTTGAITGGSLVVNAGATFGGSVLPATDDAIDLGSSSKQWRDIYTGDINLNNTKTRDNEVDGTRGSWTIQEGEDDLFILNRLNGKKYKFKLEEME